MWSIFSRIWFWHSFWGPYFWPQTWSAVELSCLLRIWAWIRTFWTKMLRNWTDQKLSNFESWRGIKELAVCIAHTTCPCLTLCASPLLWDYCDISYTSFSFQTYSCDVKFYVSYLRYCGSFLFLGVTVSATCFSCFIAGRIYTPDSWTLLLLTQIYLYY